MTARNIRTPAGMIEVKRYETNGQRGFSLLELLMVVGIIGVLAAIAIPILREAVVKAQVRAVVSEGRTVHTAFKTYYLDHDQYPDQGAGAGTFDLASFDPLTSGGYYEGAVGQRLVNRQPDAYGAPDASQEFYLEMTLKIDTTKRFLVADSDDSPLGGGASKAYDGVYAFDNGQQMDL